MASISQRARAGGYATPEDYVRVLLEDGSRHADQQALEAELVARLESGDFVRMDDDDFREIREDVAASLLRGRQP